VILIGSPEELKGVDHIPFDAPIYSIREQLQLPFVIPRCDLFWSPHYNIPVLPMRARHLVATVHDVYHLAFGAELSWIQRFYARSMLSRVGRLCDKVITVSWFSASEILQHVGIAGEKVEVIYPGLDHELFYPRVEKRSVRGISRPFFLCVGNQKPHKNIRVALEAFRRFRSTVEEGALVLVGKRGGAVTEFLEEYPLLQNDIYCFEDVDDQELPLFYRQAVALIFPSLYEGFGFPPLEMLACGGVAIVSAIGALKESCGDAALFVDPRSPADVAEKMALAWRREAPDGGIAWARRFNWKESGEKHVRLMEAVR
jgi:glycosyltransferase involved in cell wall biosynthesis